MTGYALAMSGCVGCGDIFMYNPVHVPSITIPVVLGGTGTREPICPSCVAAANVLRRANGLDPIVPHPEAYEACEEADLH